MIAHNHYKRIRRLVKVLCGNCFGTGIAPAKYGQNKCPQCKGTGEVDKWIIEVVSDEE